MKTYGIRALRQNASKVIAEVKAGETVTITDRGKPVAQITPLPKSRLQQLIDAGLATPGKGQLSDLDPPVAVPGLSLTEELLKMREDERY